LLFYFKIVWFDIEINKLKTWIAKNGDIVGAKSNLTWFLKETIGINIVNLSVEYERFDDHCLKILWPNIFVTGRFCLEWLLRSADATNSGAMSVKNVVCFVKVASRLSMRILMISYYVVSSFKFPTVTNDKSWPVG
jgi:hypothetical protein